MSIYSHVGTRSPRVIETANTLLTPATGAMILIALAIAQVVLVQLGVLPWTLSEFDPSQIGSMLTN